MAVAPALFAQATSPAPAVGDARQDEPVSLSVFEVTTSKDIGYQSTNAAEVTRMNTPIENIPMNVTVFNQQFIEDLVATDTSQLLAYEASAVKTTENDGFLARGSASVGTNFLNGFAQTSGFGSQPLANIERVEVIRGPAAVLYGSGGYGGTFNRITKQPQPDMFATARAIFSDHSSVRTEVDFNTPLPVFGGDKFMFRINGDPRPRLHLVWPAQGGEWTRTVVALGYFPKSQTHPGIFLQLARKPGELGDARSRGRSQGDGHRRRQLSRPAA